MVNMGKYTTISVKVPVKMKEELKKYRVNVAEVVRNALKKAITEAKLKELENEIAKLSQVLDKLPTEFIVKSISEDRDANC